MPQSGLLRRRIGRDAGGPPPHIWPPTYPDYPPETIVGIETMAMPAAWMNNDGCCWTPTVFGTEMNQVYEPEGFIMWASKKVGQNANFHYNALACYSKTIIPNNTALGTLSGAVRSCALVVVDYPPGNGGYPNDPGYLDRHFRADVVTVPGMPSDHFWAYLNTWPNTEGYRIDRSIIGTTTGVNDVIPYKNVSAYDFEGVCRIGKNHKVVYTPGVAPNRIYMRNFLNPKGASDTGWTAINPTSSIWSVARSASIASGKPIGRGHGIIMADGWVYFAPGMDGAHFFKFNPDTHEFLQASNSFMIQAAKCGAVSNFAGTHMWTVDDGGNLYRLAIATGNVDIQMYGVPKISAMQMLPSGKRILCMPEGHTEIITLHIDDSDPTDPVIMNFDSLNFLGSSSSTGFYNIALAPNGKVYSMSRGTNTLYIINMGNAFPWEMLAEPCIDIHQHPGGLAGTRAASLCSKI